MKINQVNNVVYVTRTHEDEGAVWPESVFHTDDVDTVEVCRIDVEDAPLMIYKRITPVPVLDHIIHPQTFEYTMVPYHIWNVYMGDTLIDTINIIASKSLRIRAAQDEERGGEGY